MQTFTYEINIPWIWIDSCLKKYWTQDKLRKTLKDKDVVKIIQNVHEKVKTGYTKR